MPWRQPMNFYILYLLYLKKTSIKNNSRLKEKFYENSKYYLKEIDDIEEIDLNLLFNC